MKMTKMTKMTKARRARIDDQKRWEAKSLELRTKQPYCSICGSKKNLNVHHIIPRECKELKFDDNNLIVLCCKHHKFNFEISAHKNPFTFFLWLRRNDSVKFKYLSKYLESKKYPSPC